MVCAEFVVTFSMGDQSVKLLQQLGAGLGKKRGRSGSVENVISLENHDVVSQCHQV